MVMAFGAVIESRKVGWRRSPIMGNIFMADDARKFTSAGYLFQIPGTEDLYYLSALFIQLLGQDHDLLFLLLQIVLMAFDTVLIQFPGHIGEPARSIGKLAA